MKRDILRHITTAKSHLPIIDRAVAPVRRDLATCNGRGCSSCCQQMVTTSFTDGMRIAEHLLTRPELLAKFRSGMSEQLALYERIRGGRTRYWNERRDCIFLSAGPERTCKIYEARPIPCRFYMVRSDPAWCDERSNDAHLLEQIAMPAEDEYQVSCFDVETGLGLKQPVPVPLPISIFWGLTLCEFGVDGWTARYAFLPKTDVRGLPFWIEVFQSEELHGEIEQAATLRRELMALTAKGIDTGNITVREMHRLFREHCADQSTA